MATREHTVSVGEIELTVMDDGSFTLPSAYFANVPDVLDLDDHVEIGANVWKVRTGDRVVLIDTGSANALQAMFPNTGQAWGSLTQEDVTDVIITHMHADHIGGFADPSAFAGAVIHVSKREWLFWTDPALIDAVPEDMRPMVQMIQSVAAGIAHRVITHDAESTIAPGLQLIDLPGHTPGHVGVRIHEGGAEALIIGDSVISDALQIAHPEITYALDTDGPQAVETRSRLLDMVSKSGTLIAATHFSFPGLGKVEQDGYAYRFVPH